MRAKGAERGDGPPAGVHLPIAHGRNRAATASDHGLHFRGKHGEANNKVVINFLKS